MFFFAAFCLIPRLVRDVYIYFTDLFKWDLSSVLGDDDDDDDDAKGKREDDDGSPQSNCDCEGPKCNCCVDFNISSIIDLGGPGKSSVQRTLTGQRDAFGDRYIKCWSSNDSPTF